MKTADTSIVRSPREPLLPSLTAIPGAEMPPFETVLRSRTPESAEGASRNKASQGPVHRAHAAQRHVLPHDDAPRVDPRPTSDETQQADESQRELPEQESESCPLPDESCAHDPADAEETTEQEAAAAQAAVSGLLALAAPSPPSEPAASAEPTFDPAAGPTEDLAEPVGAALDKPTQGTAAAEASPAIAVADAKDAAFDSLGQTPAKQRNAADVPGTDGKPAVQSGANLPARVDGQLESDRDRDAEFNGRPVNPAFVGDPEGNIDVQESQTPAEQPPPSPATASDTPAAEPARLPMTNTPAVPPLHTPSNGEPAPRAAATHQAAGRGAAPPLEIDTPRLLARVSRAFHIAQQRSGELRLRLSPPELGSLRLSLRVEEGVMTARLETETQLARTALIDQLPVLRERLAEQGVRIERFDVDLMQHRGQEPGGREQEPGTGSQGSAWERTKASTSHNEHTLPQNAMRALPPSPTSGLNVVV